MNDDATMHNVHAMPIINQEFNQSLIMQGSRMLADLHGAGSHGEAQVQTCTAG